MMRAVEALGWLQKAVLGLFAAAICAGIFLPVYTDEVGWRFQERAGIDGVDKLFSDLCGPNTLAVPPFFMMPVRYYSAVFNTAFADPFYLRLSGVAYALVWIVLLLALIRRVGASRRDRLVMATLGFGLMGLGVMPMLLVWSRPEQPVVLVTTAVLLFAWKHGQVEASRRAAWLRSAAIVLLAVIAFSYHLKGLFLTPVFLAGLFFASRGRAANAPRLVMAGLIIVLAGWSAEYWVHRLQCPDDPILRASFAANSNGMALTASRNLSELAGALGKVLGTVSLTDYFALATPRPYPLSSWLEPRQIGSGLSALWHDVLVGAWWAAVLLAAVSVLLRAWRAWRGRRLDTRLVFALALMSTVLGWSATQLIRNFYEAIFVLPLVMLAVILALEDCDAGKWTRRAMGSVAVIIGLLGLASIVTLASLYGPSIARANGQTGYIAAQPVSLPVFGYAALESDILGAARKCGIGDPATAQALMVDDLTYFTFMRSRLPQHRLGVLGLWRGSMGDPMAYLRSRGSDGAVLGCHYLPADLRARAKSQGRFCCLGPPNW